MASRGTEIHSLQQKLRIFAEILHQAGAIEKKTISALAQKLGSNYDTLKSSWREGRLSDDIIEECANLGHFTEERHYFIDPNIPPKDRFCAGKIYQGRDTVEAFRAMLLRKLGVSPISTRLYGRPSIRNRNIAWFQIDDAGQARVQGGVSELFLAAGLDTIEYEDISIGITSVRIRISFPITTCARATRLVGTDKAVELGGALLSAKPADMLPEWRLESKIGVLNGDFVTTEEPLFEISGLSLGEEFTASLSFKPSRALNVETATDEPISLVKRRILGALFTESLEDEPDRDGWITLGVQKIRLVRGDEVVA